jgi:hypothetical protein
MRSGSERDQDIEVQVSELLWGKSTIEMHFCEDSP